MPTIETKSELSESIIHTKRRGLEAVMDRVLYPADGDFPKVISRLTIPTLVGMTAESCAGVSTITSLIHHESTLLTAAEQNIIPFIAVNTYFLISSGCSVVVLLSSMREKQLYGNLLSVYKRTMTNNSFVGQLFPELRHARFYGELHFIGDVDSKTKFPKDKIQATREGFIGLYELALACKGNDPSLDQIDFFAGTSTIVSPNFKRLGFQVVEDSSKSTLNLADKILYSPLAFISLFSLLNKQVHIPEGTARVALIPRTRLVDNIDLWKKLGRVDATPQQSPVQ